jgi:hypothetical protein
MNRSKNSARKPASSPIVRELRKQPPSDTRSAVLLSLIVCPNGGVGHRRHGQGAGRAA